MENRSDITYQQIIQSKVAASVFLRKHLVWEQRGDSK